MALRAFVVENHFHLLVTPWPKKHLATRWTCYGRDTQQRRIGDQAIQFPEARFTAG